MLNVANIMGLEMKVALWLTLAYLHMIHLHDIFINIYCFFENK